MIGTNTLILQSDRKKSQSDWIGLCTKSITQWAQTIGADYRWLGDELFDPLPNDVAEKLRSFPVVLSDLGRLYALRSALQDGYESVVWFDADFLIFAPEHFKLPDTPYALGREVWVDRRGSGFRVFRKVHNAFLMFRQGNPFLSFYIHACERILNKLSGAPAPQIVGPKLLSLIHNAIECPVAEHAAAFSPAVINDLATGKQRAIESLLGESMASPLGANLCRSSIARGDVSVEEMTQAARRLLDLGQMPEP